MTSTVSHLNLRYHCSFLPSLSTNMRTAWQNNRANKVCTPAHIQLPLSSPSLSPAAPPWTAEDGPCPDTCTHTTTHQVNIVCSTSPSHPLIRRTLSDVSTCSRGIHKINLLLSSVSKRRNWQRWQVILILSQTSVLLAQQ